MQEGEKVEQTLSALKERARSLHWLDPERKRTLPRYPKVIGLVTGQSSRAHGDVMGSLRSTPTVEAEVVLEGASMLGPDAAQEVRAALDTLNARQDVEVIVIARGGGRKGELAAFNDWELAQAIVESRVPVVTAIGHRQDETLADLVADARAHTPSLVGTTLTKDQPKERDATLVVVLTVVIVIALTVVARALGWI